MSIRPRGCRRSSKRRDVLVNHRIQVGPESVGINGGTARERREYDPGGDELSGPDWVSSPTGTPLRVTRNDSPRSSLQHDLATRVAELALRD